MKILIVCSGNAPHFKFDVHKAFVFDQVNSIIKNYPKIKFDYFFIKGKGIKGYLSNLKKLKRYLATHEIDIIHAHFALSGFLANLQRSVPVICTFHGSDINKLKNRIFSIFVATCSRKTIFVSKYLYKKAIIKKDENIIPCGVDIEIFKPTDKERARHEMNLITSKQYILFSSSFNNKIKNYQLLKEALDHIKDNNIEILELKDRKRKEVALLMNAVDICVMTSFSEGSPQFIKEAMACNCSIVSTDVGDVRDVFGNTAGCFITNYEVNDVIAKIILALDFATTEKTHGRKRIIELCLDSESIAKQVAGLYMGISSKNI